jgi:hypothetical protein
MRLDPRTLHALALRGAAVRLEQLRHEVAVLERLVADAPGALANNEPPRPRRTWTKTQRAAHARRMRAAWRRRRAGRPEAP